MTVSQIAQAASIPRSERGACRIPGNEACGRVLLVGEDNPLSQDPRYALYHEPRGCAGGRLQARILGVQARQTYLPMWRTNLCAVGWDPVVAVCRAVELCVGRPSWGVIVMLGTKVAVAFERGTGVQVDSLGEPARSSIDGPILVAIPHPSGRNLAWNDRANVQTARAILREVAPDIPWGELEASPEGRIDAARA